MRFVTSFSLKGYHEYGVHLVETFRRFRAADDVLVAYSEDGYGVTAGIEIRDLRYASLGYQVFRDRYALSPVAHGRVETKSWRDSDRRKGYSFRTDAVKFAHKVFSIAAFAGGCEQETFYWIDADVRIHAMIPRDLERQTLHRADVAYLGRAGAHSECGFLAFRMPEASPLILAWADAYMTGRVFNMDEWHDSYVFDRVRQDIGFINARDMTPGGHGAVWNMSPLRSWSDHHKGERKAEPVRP